jgi:hypothetical protein
VDVLGAQLEMETTDPFCGYTNPPELVVWTGSLPGIEMTTPTADAEGAVSAPLAAGATAARTSISATSGSRRLTSHPVP